MKNKLWIIGGILLVAVVGVIAARPWIHQIIVDYKHKDSIVLYTKITQEGKQEEKNANNKNEVLNYEYHSDAIGEDGKVKRISFYSIDGKRFRLGTYLRVWWSEDRGVISWEVIEESEVPSYASQLTKES